MILHMMQADPPPHRPQFGGRGHPPSTRFAAPDRPNSPSDGPASTPPHPTAAAAGPGHDADGEAAD